MIPIPKPKFFERKKPAGQSEDDFFDEIIARQAHILRDAIDRVSFFVKVIFYRRTNSLRGYGEMAKNVIEWDMSHRK